MSSTLLWTMKATAAGAAGIYGKNETLSSIRKPFAG
jgi:hypothetical protein